MWYIVGGLIVLSICFYIYSQYDRYAEFSKLGITSIILILSFIFIQVSDYKHQTDDEEIWSGKIESVEHIEEWDEWIPPRTETYTTTDSKGRTTTHTRVIPGYWVHHDAENYVTTTDDGTNRVYKVPNGKKLTDNFVNSTKELEEHYPIGRPTASVHSYENKLKASNSIFKHREINPDDFEGLPEYPTKDGEYFTVNRVFGKFDEKEKVEKKLDQINSVLNDTKNPNNKENVKSYKQVNIMLVNFGNKPEDYGYALQEYWENGAKNDVIITFGTDNNGKPTWSYVFGWTDSEILKSDLREYIMGLDNIKDFEKNLDEISNIVEDKFVRKEFAEFDYIQINLTTGAKIIMLIVLIGCCVAIFLMD